MVDKKINVKKRNFLRKIGVGLVLLFATAASPQSVTAAIWDSKHKQNHSWRINGVEAAGIDSSGNFSLKSGVSVNNINNSFADPVSHNNLITEKAIHDTEIKARLKSMYNQYNDELHRVISYDVDGNVEKIEVFAEVGHTTKLFTRNISYSDDVVSEIETIDEINSLTLTKSINYDVEGNVTTMPEVYS